MDSYDLKYLSKRHYLNKTQHNNITNINEGKNLKFSLNNYYNFVNAPMKDFFKLI